jgi:hypothetical protein
MDPHKGLQKSQTAEFKSVINLKKLIKRKMRYYRWIRQFVRNGVDILQNVFFSDEAWFHLSGYLNSQNSRFWSSEIPTCFMKCQYIPRKLAVGVRYLVNGL